MTTNQIINRSLFLSLFLTTTFFVQGYAAVYYVSPTGNDTAPGTSSLPFRTINRASQRALLPGDQVLVRAGNYGDEFVVTQAGGTSGNPITFQAEGVVTLQSFYIFHPYIVIDGFHLTGQWDVVPTSHINVLTSDPFNPTSPNGSYCVVRNNFIENTSTTGVNGIELDSTIRNCQLIGNTIDNINGMGILLRGTNHDVRQNTIMRLHGYDALVALGRDHKIQFNTIKDSPNPGGAQPNGAYAALRAWGVYDDSQNILFSNNQVDGFNGSLGILWQHSVYGTHVGSWTISNNIFSNVTAPFQIMIPSMTFTNNTLFHVSDVDPSAIGFAEFDGNTADGGLVKYNAFVACGKRDGSNQGGWYTIENDVQMKEADYNFVAGYEDDGYPSKANWTEAHGMNGGDPRFLNIADPLSGGLRPSDDSPLCQTLDRPQFGAVPCQCTVTTPVGVIVSSGSTQGPNITLLDGSQSHSCGSRIQTYAWNFGDGQTGSGPTLSHTYSTPGNYTIQLTVTNNRSQSVTVTKVITINSTPTLLVNAGIDKSIQLHRELVVLNDARVQAFAVTNPVTVLWSKESGPGSVVFIDTKSVNTMTNFSAVGTYVLRLTATSGALTSDDSVQVTVLSGVNSAPVVFAGSNKTLVLPDPIIYTDDATVSDDGFPDPPGVMTYVWTKVSGPGPVVFGSTYSIGTSVSFSSVGVHVLRLEANDYDQKASATVQVTVLQNLAPVVNAGANKSITLPTNNVTLNDATVSDDNLPNPPAQVSVEWQLDSGPAAVTFDNPNSVQTIARFTQIGTYILKLIASDSWTMGTDTVTVTVQSPTNQPPVVNAGSDKSVLFPNELAVLSDSVISDDGLPVPPGRLTYQWVKNSGPGVVSFGNATSSRTWASFTAAGTYVLRLTVNDGALSTSDNVQISVVNPPNAAPVVDAGANKSVLLPTESALLNDSVITDDGLPNPPARLTFQWTRDSGPGTVTFGNATSSRTSASFAAEGTYVLRLTVSDGALSTFDTVTITARTSGVNSPPMVDAGSNRTVVFPSELAMLIDTSVSDDGLPNPPRQVTVQWTKDSGPGTVTFGNSTSSQTTASFSALGTYVLRLTAFDGALSASDPVTVTVVLGGQNQAPDVEAGTAKTIASIREQVNLNDATIWDDGLPLPRNLTVLWTQDSGPGVVSFGKANSTNTWASFSSEGVYTLRLSASDGEKGSFDTVVVTVGTAQNVDLNEEGFAKFVNIFSPKKGETLNIEYRLLKSNNIQLVVFTRLGQEVKRLDVGSKHVSDPLGTTFSVDWDGRNEEGAVVASGVYILVLKTDQDVYKTKLALP